LELCELSLAANSSSSLSSSTTTGSLSTTSRRGREWALHSFIDRLPEVLHLIDEKKDRKQEDVEVLEELQLDSKQDEVIKELQDKLDKLELENSKFRLNPRKPRDLYLESPGKVVVEPRLRAESESPDEVLL